MTEKSRLLNTMKAEHPITVKVMKAYPSDKMDFKSHERSFTTAELLGRLVGEQAMIAKLPKGGFGVPTENPKHQELSLNQLVEAFESGFKEVMEVLESTPEADFEHKKTNFFGHEMNMCDACWVLLKDQIHHRGQLSVYIRMAGGKVPSIYGPSADDPGI